MIQVLLCASGSLACAIKARRRGPMDYYFETGNSKLLYAAGGWGEDESAGSLESLVASTSSAEDPCQSQPQLHTTSSERRCFRKGLWHTGQGRIHILFVMPHHNIGRPKRYRSLGLD
jgi:hypothetical protein